MRVVEVNNNENLIKKFTNIPKMLYNSDERTHSKNEETQLLTKNHVLSHYFELYAFLVLSEKEKPLARCIVTFYHNSNKAYLGLFECIDNLEVSEKLFNSVEKFCKQHNKYEIVGPVDASPWIKYRLKVDNFNKPYTGEPYNKSYYKKMFDKAGYSVLNKFISTYYDTSKSFTNIKAQKRLDEKLKQGYKIVGSNPSNIQSDLVKVYRLLSKLYKDLPEFKQISEQEFIAIFKDFNKICDYTLIKAAYKDDTLVGFFISIPNYSSILCGDMTIIKLFRFLRLKKNPKEFVILYLGVEKGHAGLGVAMAELLNRELVNRRMKCIGALIQEGKVTAGYFGDKIEKKSTYELLHKLI